MSRRNPRALAARHAAPYSMLHAFRAPSVQTRFTSSVQPLSSFRATGRPTIATPRTVSPSLTASQNFAPGTGLWCRWFRLTKVFASSSVIGVRSSIRFSVVAAGRITRRSCGTLRDKAAHRPTTQALGLRNTPCAHPSRLHRHTWRLGVPGLAPAHQQCALRLAASARAAG